MNVITRESRAAEAASMWKDQCHIRITAGDKSRHDIYDLLKKATSADEVDEIVGNKSWTRVTCNECDRDVNVAVQLGEEPDYESNTATICLECLQDALSMAGARTMNDVWSWEYKKQLLDELEFIKEERDQLREELKRAKDALRQVEWVYYGEDDELMECPWCEEWKESGHKPSCPRQLALGSAAEQEE